jgi:hypothetical protein
LKTSLEIVFFHEIGHFISHQLNYKHFGIGEVDKIILIEKRPHGVVEYEGQTISKVPNGKTNLEPILNLPEKIAELIYGCYFQSIFLNKELDICFDYRNKSARGYRDSQNLIGGLSQFNIDENKRRKLYPYLKEKYFNELKKHTYEFELLFKLNPMDFLKENENGFEVELKKLDNSLTEFMEKHSTDFIEFVENIREILNKKNVG